MILRQNLAEREGVKAILELPGEVTIRQGRDHLKRKGLLPPQEDLIEEGELDYTRLIFQKTRTYKDHDGKKEGFVHLFKYDDQGKKRDVYKRPRDTTLEEAAQDVDYWLRNRKIADRRLRERISVYSEIHGRDRLMELVPALIQLEFELVPPDDGEDDDR